MSLFDFDSFDDSFDDDFFSNKKKIFSKKKKKNIFLNGRDYSNMNFEKQLNDIDKRVSRILNRQGSSIESIIKKAFNNVYNDNSFMKTGNQGLGKSFSTSSIFTYDLVSDPGFSTAKIFDALSFKDYKKSELSKVKVGEEFSSKLYMSYIKELVTKGYKPYQIIKILKEEDILTGNRNMYSLITPIYHAYKKNKNESNLLNFLDTLIQTI